MAISEKDISKVAHLARIGLSEGELSLFSQQLETIIEFIDKLKEVDVSSVKPMSHVLEMNNVLRVDEKKESLRKEEALKNAPESANGHFRVPKVIE